MPGNERRSIECEHPHTLLTNPTGSIIQAPSIVQMFILHICNQEKDFAWIFLDFLYNND